MAGEATLILKAIIDDYADKMAKVQALNDKLMAQIGQLVKQTQKGSDEEIAMGRAAKRVLEEIRTPAERYAQQMRELNMLLEKGKLTQEQYGRAAAKARDGMQPPSGAGVQGWVQGQLGSLVSLAAGYITVSKAIEVATAGYDKYWKAAKEAAEVEDRIEKALVKTATAAGQIANLKNLEQFLKTPGVPGGATREQVQTTYQGVSEGAPMEPFERQKAMTRQAARIAPLVGGDLEKMRQFGTAVGRFSEAFPDKTPEQLANLAYKARTMVGAEEAEQLSDREFQRLLRRGQLAGIPAEEILAMGVTAIKNKERVRSVTTLMEKILEPTEPPARHPGKRPTPKEEIETRWAKAPPLERLVMAREDEKVRATMLGAKGIAISAGMPPAQVAANLAILRSGTLSEDVKELAKSETGQEVLRDQKIAVKKDVEIQKVEFVGKAKDAMERFRERKLVLQDKRWAGRGWESFRHGLAVISEEAGAAEEELFGAKRLTPGITREERILRKQGFSEQDIQEFKMDYLPKLPAALREKEEVAAAEQKTVAALGPPRAIGEEARKQEEGASLARRHVKVAEQQLEATNKLQKTVETQGLKPSEVAVQNNRTTHREN